MLTSPAEIAFHIFSYPIHYYGIVMAISMIVGIFFAKFICEKFYSELNPEDIYNLAPVIIISSVIGARLYYCLLSIDYFSQNPIEILQVWHGGLSIQGGILGGLLGGILYAQKHSMPILRYCDIFSFGLVLGQIIGRWGNFFNSEAFGRPCGSGYFLRLFIPISKRPIEFMQYDFFHPTFLYESLLNCVVLAVLLMLLRYRNKLHSGVIFFSYLAMYSLVRIFIETIRIDSVLNIFGVPIAIIVSLISIIISVSFIYFLQRQIG